MRKGRSSGKLRAGVAAGVAGLVVGTMAGSPAMASPDDEAVWEEGTVTSISDGDTLVANLDAGSGARGSQRIRTIGVQAPEVAHNGSPAECGSAQATDRLMAQLPVGARVQTRSVSVYSNDDYSSGRIVRSLYAQDGEGNWYDTSRQTVSDGWMMWFPLAADSSNKPEWAHNLEYRVLADDAAGQGRGLWSAGLCGGSPYPGMSLRVWARYYGTEQVFVENNNPYDVDLSGWTIRDSAISGYRVLPAGTIVPAGQVRQVYSGDLNLNNLPADNGAFEGDALYLMDNAGPYKTGNLRAWFPYPCNPDECGDPLQGRVSITKVQDTTPPVTQVPSAPGSVTATASTDGTGIVNVSWAPSVDPQAPSVTYTVTPTSDNGGSPLTPATGITGLSHSFTGLALGRAYSFTVTAVNSAGASSAAGSTATVTPVGPPATPTDVVAEARDASAVVSWTESSTGGTPTVSYTARAVEDPTKTCTTDDGATSCLIGAPSAPLANGTPYTFVVTATNSVATSTPSSPSGPVTPNPYGLSGKDTPPGAPASVVARPSDGGAVVSWARPTDDGGSQIVEYEVVTYLEPRATTPTPVPDATCSTSGSTAGVTSCVVPRLTNGSSYSFDVRARNAKHTGPWAALPPESAVTPYRYAPGAGPTPPGPAPTPVADPYVPGEFVELSNTSDTEVRLGGYGFWNTASSRFVNGGSIEDRAAYLFPADTRVSAGKKLRVHFGNGATPPLGTPEGVSRIMTTDSEFIGSTGDYVELANLNRAQVSCVPTPGGTCRGTKPVSISSAPVGVTARTTDSNVSVNWGAPISRGGTAITQYTATAFDAPIGGNPVASCTAGGGERTCSFPGGNGTTYFVEVVAHNSQGISGPSWRVRAVPKTVPSAPGNVAVSGTPGGVNVTWTPAAENGAAITKYTASAYTAGTGGNPVGSCTTNNGSLGGCTIMKLQGGTQYYIDVVATNRAGNGAPSSPRTPGMPGPGGAVSTYSKGKVTVRWDLPTPGSNTITGYTAKVYTKASGGSKVGECSAPAGKTSCTTKKMRKRSKYYIDLTMQSAAGAFTVRPRIVSGPAKKASAPKVTSATPSGRQVVITWAPPTFNGYSYLKGYGARLYSKSKGGSVKASCSAGPATLTCTTKSVKKGTYYSAVRVKNSKGWSSWSKRVKVVVR